ncbi:hypothetical protein [Streptomyces sp. NPDC017964]
MSGTLIEAPPADAPAGTEVVAYACLASQTLSQYASLAGVRRFIQHSGWRSVAELVDFGTVTDPGPERPRRTEALKLVESGVAAGIVVPSYAMLFFHHDERSEFYAWQRRTGAWVSSPWNTAAVA